MEENVNSLPSLKECDENVSMQICHKKRGRPISKTRPPESEIASLYNLMTARDIAERYGVPISTVRGWIQTYRKKKPKGENSNG